MFWEERLLTGPNSGDPASSRVRNMLRDDYVKVSTPPENDWLDEVAIYIRKEK